MKITESFTTDCLSSDHRENRVSEEKVSLCFCASLTATTKHMFLSRFDCGNDPENKSQI